MAKRLTIPNHRVNPMQDVTYHTPMHWVEKFRMETFGSGTYLYGELVDKLGRYEDLGTPEELAKRLNIKTEWTK